MYFFINFTLIVLVISLDSPKLAVRYSTLLKNKFPFIHQYMKVRQADVLHFLSAASIAVLKILSA